MKILNPGPDGETSVDAANMTPAPAPASEEQKDPEPQDEVAAFDARVVQEMEAAMNEVASERQADDAVDSDDGVGGSADINENTESDPLLSVAEEHDDTGLTDALEDIKADMAVVTQNHKDAFIESVITGKRYVEYFSLFNGKVTLKIRARSVQETDAISAYARRMIATDKVKVDYEYSALMRKLLALAQVEEMNGVKNPPMEAPLFFEETEEGINPPAWEKRLKVWGDKPEAILIAVVRCILEFEARYWHMIRNVKDENFWQPGESTGE